MVVFAWPGAVRLDSVSGYLKRNTVGCATVESVKTTGVSVARVSVSEVGRVSRA